MKSLLIQRLVTGRYSTRVFDFLYNWGLDTPVMRCIHCRERRKSQAFFKRNAPRVQRIVESLADENSKQAFAKAVLYRQTFRRKDAPPNESTPYFPRDLISLTDHEVFVDCGAFVGDTVDSFLKHCGGRFSRVVCLEPDPGNFAALSKAHLDPRIVKLPAGAWSEKTTMQFQIGKGAGSAIADQAVDHALAIPVVALDDVEACQDATFIKMDIEGAEMEALAGARQLIARCRPTLAICIYHSDEDMLRIPEHLLATLERYSFHVRHHSRNWQETVLYALPNPSTVHDWRP